MRYAIGDIHGCIKTLEKLINKIIQKDNNPQFYSVGDLIDRGPDAKAVIDFFMDLKKNYPVQIVRGNHEEMMLNTLSKDSENWFFNGAENTLRSFQNNLSHRNILTSSVHYHIILSSKIILSSMPDLISQVTILLKILMQWFGHVLKRTTQSSLIIKKSFMGILLSHFSKLK